MENEEYLGGWKGAGSAIDITKLREYEEHRKNVRLILEAIIEVAETYDDEVPKYVRRYVEENKVADCHKKGKKWYVFKDSDGKELFEAKEKGKHVIFSKKTLWKYIR